VPDALTEADLRSITDAAIDAGAIQKGAEFAALLEIASWEPRLQTILEIGSAVGGTLLGWRRAFPDARVLAVDLPGGPYSSGAPIVTPEGVELIVGDSHKPETLAAVKAALGDEQVDLLFIDGDHTFMGVRNDFAMYGPLVRPGGIIAFHDICQHPAMPDVEVEKFWRGLRWPAWRYEIITEPDTWGGIGILKLPERFPEQSIPPEPGGPPLAVLIPSSGTNSSAFTNAYRFLTVPRGGIRQALPMGAYIPQNLRAGTQILLKDPSWRRLLILETDMLPPFDALVRHVEHTKPIVGSAYFRHSPPYNCYAWHTKDTRIKELSVEEMGAMLDNPGTYPVDAVGFGCTSIAREVIEGWPTSKPLFHNSWRRKDANVPGHAGEVGHDILFCKEARDQGYQPYLDTAIQCGHIGTVVVAAETWRSHNQPKGAPNGEVSGYPSAETTPSAEA